MRGGRRSPAPHESQKIGSFLLIYPASGFLTVATTLKDAYGQILVRRSTKPAADAMYPISKMCERMGFAEELALNLAHAELGRRGSTRLSCLLQAAVIPSGVYTMGFSVRLRLHRTAVAHWNLSAISCVCQ